MGRTAVIYSSGMAKALIKDTKNIGDYIARQLKADRFDLKDITMIDITEFDRIVFGTGVLLGKPFKEVGEFIENNKDAVFSKELHLFVTGIKDDEKGVAMCEAIAHEYGISDAAILQKASKVPEENNGDGYHSSVDQFIARLK